MPGRDDSGLGDRVEGQKHRRDTPTTPPVTYAPASAMPSTNWWSVSAPVVEMARSRPCRGRPAADSTADAEDPTAGEHASAGREGTSGNSTTPPSATKPTPTTPANAGRRPSRTNDEPGR